MNVYYTLWFVSRPHPMVCAWCKKVTPKEQLTPITTTVDADTGMTKAEELVCDDCINPHRQAQAETDATSEPAMPDIEYIGPTNKEYSECARCQCILLGPSERKSGICGACAFLKTTAKKE